MEAETDKNQEIYFWKQLRQQAGLTRPQVRDIIRVCEHRQADWETGQAMPNADNIAALCRLYKVSLKTMFKSLGVDVSDIPHD